MIPRRWESYKLGSRVPARIYRLVTSHDFAVSCVIRGLTRPTYLLLARSRY